MNTHTEGERRVERKICIQPRAVDNGLKGPHPFFITADGLVGEQERWEGAPTLLEGFVHDPNTTGTVDLDFEDFWVDPASCLGMHPVFTHDVGDGDSIFTHGDKTIAHVSITEKDGHVSLRAAHPGQPDSAFDLKGDPVDIGDGLVFRFRDGTPMDTGVTMSHALYTEMRDKAREYDDLMAAETSGREVRIKRSDYISLLDIAILMTRLRAQEEVEIDDRRYKLVDANSQPEGSAALMLTSLATGAKVKLNGQDHTLISTDKLKELRAEVAFLYELEAMGVDNWDGYPLARQAYNESRPEEDEN